jgi:hypothetical protein
MYRVAEADGSLTRSALADTVYGTWVKLFALVAALEIQLTF